jgi:hypothetical protein
VEAQRGNLVPSNCLPFFFSFSFSFFFFYLYTFVHSYIRTFGHSRARARPRACVCVTARAHSLRSVRRVRHHGNAREGVSKCSLSWRALRFLYAILK